MSQVKNKQEIKTEIKSNPFKKQINLKTLRLHLSAA